MSVTYRTKCVARKKKKKRSVRTFLNKKNKKPPRLQRRTCPRKKNRNALQKKEKKRSVRTFLNKNKKNLQRKTCRIALQERSLCRNPARKKNWELLCRNRLTRKYKEKNLLKLS